MTNRDFILADIEYTGDFTQEEIEAIKEGMKLKRHQRFLSSEYSGYDSVEMFYSGIEYDS